MRTEPRTKAGDSKLNQKNKEQTLRILAIIMAFATVFFFFFKIIF